MIQAWIWYAKGERKWYVLRWHRLKYNLILVRTWSATHVRCGMGSDEFPETDWAKPDAWVEVLDGLELVP